MAVERGLGARLRYRWEEFLSGGAGKQLFFLFALTMLMVVGFALLSLVGGAAGVELAEGSLLDRGWFYFTRLIDPGTMGSDAGNPNRLVSTAATVAGVVVAGLLISALAGNFQERLEGIRRGGAPVMEDGHFLVLGWSEKIFSVLDQLSEAYASEGPNRRRRDGRARQGRDGGGPPRQGPVPGPHEDRGAQRQLGRAERLEKVSFARAHAIVVLVDDADVEDPDKADARVMKTLMALYNHPDARGIQDKLRVTAEVMQSHNQELAIIASNNRARVVKTNEMISKIILQTARIPGLCRWSTTSSCASRATRSTSSRCRTRWGGRSCTCCSTSPTRAWWASPRRTARATSSTPLRIA